MLRIERKSRNLRLRKSKTRLISRPLVWALAVALAMHLFAVVLFRFPVFQPNYPPAQKILVIQTEPFDGQLVANIDSVNTSEPDYLLSRTASPDATFVLKPHRTQTSLAQDLFSSVEEPLTNPILPLPNAPRTTRIFISGPLAEYTVDQTAALKIGQTATQAQRLKFAVEVDAREGLIRWYAPLAQTTDLAEKVLRALVFSIPNQIALIPGEIEVVLND